MDAPSKEFALAGSLEELKAKGRLVVHGAHRPILVIYDRGRIFALDNRCPHMGFPLERGSVEDGILTCHWHHARFDLESGCTFDLWADDVPICPVEVRNGEVWVKTTFGHADPAAHWHQRLADGSRTTSVWSSPRPCMVSSRPRYRGPTLCGRWRCSEHTIATVGAWVSPFSRRSPISCLCCRRRKLISPCSTARAVWPPRRERAPLGSRPEPAALKRWLRRWTSMRLREAFERTLLTAIAAGASPGVLADALLTAETERAFADTGHSLVSSTRRSSALT
jgi:nitrite reductase/ring-hydroxylating ferredoxin subunit